MFDKILEEKDCFTLKQLAVGGRDLIAAGIPAGPALGEVLAHLLELVIEEPKKNDRQWLMEEAIRFYKN